MSAQPGDPRCTVIVLAGPSGSGKSRLTRATGATQLRLDDFYRADTDPQLPMAGGRIDWDDVRSWDADAATTALICSRVLMPGAYSTSAPASA